MRTIRENVMAIYNKEQPDFYCDFMDAVTFVKDPAFLSDRVPQDGEIHQDSWGTEFVFLPGTPGKHPLDRHEGLVIKDIEKWEDELVVPDISNYDWSSAIEQTSQIDRTEKFVGIFNTAGLFERSHHLLGFEEALVNYMTYEDEMAGLLRTIADFKIEYIKLLGKVVKPDVLFFQDDWGSKTNVFLPPELWRRLIKPLHTEIVQTAHDCGMLFMHHADCYCMPLVEDMAEMNIDIWQGAIPQNDLCEVQRLTNGKLAMTGGIDGALIDTDNATEEVIRGEVRRAIDEYCPGGRFFPGISSGKLIHEWNQSIAKDELDTYGREWALSNPIK